jgi:cell division protein ZapA
MKTDLVSVKVHIMEKEYQIQCGPDEKQKLIAAAVDVDNRMRTTRRGAANINAEKAAVLTALNLANELQSANHNSDMLESVSDSIVDMKSRIDRVLDERKVINLNENAL